MASEIVCPMCGFRNAANVPRCVSCGAKLESIGSAERSAEEQHERRHQQEGFSWKWALVAFATYMVLQGIVIVGLDVAIDAYDPQGMPGILISAAVWFVGGVVVGFISPGRTFIEPAVGALLAAVPTVGYLMHIDVVYKLSLLAYIIGGLIGVMVTLFGAFVGEKLQMMGGERAKT